MQKHPRISSGIQQSSCSFASQLLLSNIPVAPNAFSRYIGKASFIHKPSTGIRAYKLPCGCFIWCYASGVRVLSLLPF